MATDFLFHHSLQKTDEDYDFIDGDEDASPGSKANRFVQIHFFLISI